MKFNEVLRYLFKFIKLLNTIFYLKFQFKLKVDPKICSFQNLEKMCPKYYILGFPKMLSLTVWLKQKGNSILEKNLEF